LLNRLTDASEGAGRLHKRLHPHRQHRTARRRDGEPNPPVTEHHLLRQDQEHSEQLANARERQGPGQQGGAGQGAGAEGRGTAVDACGVATVLENQ
jgi:hypothetical protein